MGRYSDSLSRRLRKQPVRLFNTKFFVSEAPENDFEIVVSPHPSKYPEHAGSKGSVYRGICNSTACMRTDAVFFNVGTMGYYCALCARGIDYDPKQRPICTVVDHDLTHDEMEEKYRERFH